MRDGDTLKAMGRYTKAILFLLLTKYPVGSKLKWLKAAGWVSAAYISTTVVDPAPKGFAYSLLSIYELRAGDMYRVIDPEESSETWCIRHVETGKRLSAKKEFLRT